MFLLITPALYRRGRHIWPWNQCHQLQFVGTNRESVYMEHPSKFAARLVIFAERGIDLGNWLAEIILAFFDISITRQQISIHVLHGMLRTSEIIGV